MLFLKITRPFLGNATSSASTTVSSYSGYVHCWSREYSSCLYLWLEQATFFVNRVLASLVHCVDETDVDYNARKNRKALDLTMWARF